MDEEPLTPEEPPLSGFLLPPGCKDLIDALRLEKQARPEPSPPGETSVSTVFGLQAIPDELIRQTVSAWLEAQVQAKFFWPTTVPAEIQTGRLLTVRGVAALTNVPPLMIVARLVAMGVLGPLLEATISAEDLEKLLSS